MCLTVVKSPIQQVSLCSTVADVGGDPGVQRNHPLKFQARKLEIEFCQMLKCMFYSNSYSTHIKMKYLLAVHHRRQ